MNNEAVHSGAIAIVGMAGRFPKAKTVEEFWRNLCHGTEGISFFPDSNDGGVQTTKTPSAARFVKARGLLEDADKFDAAFFGVKPVEAETMDPQHRVFLECAWAALEDAGCDPAKFDGAIGVFAGMSMNTYLANNLASHPEITALAGDYQIMLGNDKDYLPTRVSYKFGLTGPSLNVQTACSTSLVAVCVACQHLLDFQCDMALAGGVSIRFPQQQGYNYQPGGIASPDGHCRAFDAQAAGTVPGEGAGVVVLKRYQDAVADGDLIYAVIKGFATNNDGSKKVGYTAPSVDGQAEVIAQAQAMAGFDAQTISLIEAHGTGTPLGDPIEIEALARAFREHTDQKAFCAIGSVKSNIGHLDAAAGVAGLIKTTLALHHKMLPASLHFESPNPGIDFAASPFFVNTALQAWKAGATPRRAGVSSFGIGGTNAHVVLEEAPVLTPSGLSRTAQLLVLSAKTEPALDRATAQLAEHLKQNSGLTLADVAYTLHTGRRAFPLRRALVCEQVDDAIAIVTSADTKRLLTRSAAAKSPSLAFLFPGQGAQEVNMGSELYRTERDFRATVDTCCELLAPSIGLDLRGVLYPESDPSVTADPQLNNTALTQPALFVVEYALAKLWMSWGVTPEIMIGHSIGEYVAACLAGVFTLSDALRLVAERGRLMQQQPAGAMVAVRMSEPELRPLLAGSLSLAAVNGVAACVASGPSEAVAGLQEELARRRIAATLLATSHAFHSPMMEPVREPFKQLVGSIEFQAPRLPFMSNVTGKPITRQQATDPDYWGTHLVHTVRFADGLAELLKNPDCAFLEVGPGHTLTNLTRQHPARSSATVIIPSLPRRGEPGQIQTLLTALGQLWLAGIEPDWRAFYKHERRRRINLPTYPFERTRYWVEPARATNGAAQNHNPHGAVTGEPIPGKVHNDTQIHADVPKNRQEEIVLELRALLARLSGLDLSAYANTTTFAEMGFESLFLTQASLALESRFGVQIAFRRLLEDANCLADLAALVEGEISAKNGSMPALRNAAAPLTTAPSRTELNSLPPQTDEGPPQVLSIPLTAAQRELWFASQMSDDASCAFNESRAVDFRGPLQVPRLRDALKRLVERHDALRTTFSAEGDVQFVHSHMQVPLEVSEGGKAYLGRSQVGVARRSFDLVKGPLIRAELIHAENDHHVLLLTAHHLICDGHSFALLLDELTKLYTAVEQELPRANQFSDYARGQLERPQPGEEAREFWVRQFADGAPTLELPTDHARPGVWNFTGACAIRSLPTELTLGLKALSAGQSCTLFSTLLASWAVLLERLTGQSEIVVGIPVADRPQPTDGSVVGHCTHLLPLKLSLQTESSFLEHLARVKGAFLDAHEHRQFSFGELLRILNVQRAPDRMPLVSVTLNVERSAETLEMPGLTVSVTTNPHTSTHFDLSLNATESGGALRLECRYADALFLPATIERWLGHFQTLLESIVAEPGQNIGKLTLLSTAERRQLIEEWNETHAEYPEDKCIGQMFEEQVERSPDAVAAIFEEQSLTYRELNARANQVALHLRSMGVKPDVAVGICVERSVEMLVGLLGILKAGGAYVPLDPGFPKERLKYMLQDSGAPVLVTQRQLAAELDSALSAQQTLIIDSLGAAPPAPRATEVCSENLAYIIYTSGSTGRPKGIALTHRNVANFFCGMDRILGEAQGVWLAVTSISFDISVLELFWTLARGFTVVIQADDKRERASKGRPAGVKENIQRHKVTHLQCTPSLAGTLVQSPEALMAFGRLDKLILGGEPLPPSLAAQLLGAVPTLLNLYGPTETTVWSAAHEVKRAERTIPIGRPIANTQIYVLDRHQTPAPIGVPGEIWIGGDGVARGYMNLPELTTERFVPDPFRSQPGARLYRTGDRGRFQPDGVLEILGRLDDQVKVRGYRIELGEIETALHRHPQVRDCAVAAWKGAGETRLAAYLVCQGGQEKPTVGSLREYLEPLLPAYMIPATFTFLDALPLTPNGKLNRRALPAPEAESDKKFIAPRDATERQLAALWEEVLAVSPIGVLDNFFDLGGHSLLVMRLLAKIEKRTGKTLPVAALFHSPTLGQFAQVFREAEIPRSREKSSLIAIQPNGTKPPLFLVHGLGGGMFWGYTNLANHLGEDQPVYAFRSRGLEGLPEFGSIGEMAAQYVADLRVFRPHGPYLLGGYCFGGNVAYEMAQKLRAQGEEVALLALMNSIPPRSDYWHTKFSLRWARDFMVNLRYLLRWHFRRTPVQRREFVAWQFRTLAGRLGRLFGSKCPPTNARDLVDLSACSAEERPVWDAHIRALLMHETKPYTGRVMLLRSSGHQFWCSFDSAYGWREFVANGLEVRIVSGAHEQILEEPFVRTVAEALKGGLDRCPEVSTLAGKSEIQKSEPDWPTKSESPNRTGDSNNGKGQRRENAPANGHAAPVGHTSKLEYWQRQLEGAPATLDLPADRPYSTTAGTGSEGSERLPIALPKTLVSSLERFSDSENAAPFAILLTAFQAVLCRYTGNTDVVVGCCSLTSPEPRYEQVFGYCEEPLLVRGNLADNPSFRELVRRTSATLRAAWQHRDVSLDEIFASLAPGRNPFRDTKYEVVFRFDEHNVSAPINADPERTSGPSEKRASERTLTLQLTRSGERISGCVEYNRARFDTERIARLAEHFHVLLAGAMAAPDLPLAELPLLSAKERDELLVRWNQTTLRYPRQTTLTQLFEAQVARTPDATALVTPEQRLSYSKLNRLADRLAGHLRTLGVGPEVLVGICVERSWRMVAGILAVHKAGGAYVPMDPAYPKERLDFMLEDAQAPVLLTQHSLLARFSIAGENSRQRAVVCLDEDWDAFGGTRVQGPEASASNLAYVIYTSGSTGKPKGVAIEHHSPVALMHWAKEVFPRAEMAGMLAATSICFDLSIFEIFVPLSWGGTIILAENALALPALPAASEVTLVNTVPSAMRELLRVKGVPGSVRVVNLAGEPLTTALADQIYRETSVEKVYDLYGPSETTTYSTGSLRRPGGMATIGRPLANEQVYIFDGHLQPVPIGITGELYIGGEGLARGYLNRPELTAEKFVPHPLKRGERLFKTGDLARWRPEGTLEFLGRRDHQVKVRGFRIELGEIESVLRQHPDVGDAVVVANAQPSGDKRLGAYVVPHAHKSLSPEHLRAFVKLRLPQPMVPSDYAFLAALPQTPNGKLDRKALPPFERVRPTKQAVELPRTPRETALTEIWQEVLGLEQIGVRDNFFELGGNSLLAIQVVARIRSQLHLEVPLSCLFDAPTIAALEESLASGNWSREQRPGLPLEPITRSGPLLASFVQERLWFLDQLQPGGHAYHVPIAIRLKGVLDKDALARAIDEIVKRHEALRTVFAMQDGQLTQIVQAPAHLEPHFVDLRNERPDDRESAAQKALRLEARQPFDLEKGPLVRVLLAQLDAADHILGIVMHHTICDGWSLAIFFAELETLYTSFVACLPSPELPALPIQCADHAQWQRLSLNGGVLEAEEAWWKETLGGAMPSVQLPADPKVARAERDAARAEVHFSKELRAELNAFCQSQSCTPFMICLSALAITLERWTQQDDLVLGTVVAGRNRPELENVIGCFVNFLPLRIKMAAAETGREVLARTRTTVLDAQAHQDCPFQKIVKAVNPKRHTDQNPLYNVALLLQNFPPRLFQAPSIDVELVPIETEAPLLDLRFEAEETERGLSFMCEYKTALFTSRTIGHLLASFQRVLETLVHSPETKVADFPILSELKAQALMGRTPAGTDTIAVTATFTADFLAEPLRYWMKELDLPASVEFAPYGQVFQELLEPKSLLAGNDRGVNVVLLRLEDWCDAKAPEPTLAARVAKLERSAEDFIAALKSAAARSATPFLVCHCPSARMIRQDPRAGQAIGALENRIANRLSKVPGVQVVTSEELLDLYPVADHYDPQGDELGHVPYTSAFFAALATMIARKFHAIKRPPCKAIALDCDQTLWAGVCGEDGPAAVQLDPPRRALQEFMRRQSDAGRLLCLCSKNNDADVLAVFNAKSDMPLHVEHFAARQVNWKPKSENLRSLAKELNLGLENFVFLDDNPMECAEAAANCPEPVIVQLPREPELIPHFLKHCWVFDSAPATAEDARRTLFYQQNREREALRKSSLTFADFLAALDLKIDIQDMAPADVARVSQLTLRTNQFNAATHRLSEAEVQHALDEGYEIQTVRVADRLGDYGLVGVMIYKPGAATIEVKDFLLSCRVLSKGVEHKMLAHLGRVALERELANVSVHFAPSARNDPARDFLESVASQFRQAQNGGFVYALPSALADKCVFQPAEGAALPAAPALAAPAHPAPAARRFDRWLWLALEASQPEKLVALIEAGTPTRTHAPAGGEPATDLERQLCAIWEDLLHINHIGIHDDFFELGGRSLLAVRLFARIEQLTGKRLAVVTIFQSPTIAQLAQRIIMETGVQTFSSLIVPIQPEGARPPLYLVHGAGGDVMWGYANLAQHMDKEQPVFGIQARPTDDLSKFGSFEAFAADYLKELRAFQPRGPYLLGGYCFGGNLAYEMARQLNQQGEQVAFVALLESYPEGGDYKRVRWWRPDFLYHFTVNLCFWLADLAQFSPEERRSLVRRKLKVLARKCWSRIGRQPTPQCVDLDDVIDSSMFSSHEIKLWDFHLRLLAGHATRPYPGAVTVLRTKAHPIFSSYQNDLGWGALAQGGATVHVINGAHANIFLEPNVRDLAQKLEGGLAQLPGLATKQPAQNL